MHNSIWRLLWRAVGLNALLRLVISLCALEGGLARAQPAPGDPSAPPPPAGIYDPDPKHIWNRLFVAFYRQKFASITVDHSGQITEPGWVGPDMLDPPIGNHPGFLLEDQPFAKCNALLDEFLSRNGAALIPDPLKRALLLRDLWAVFDVLAQAGQFTRFSIGFPSASPPLLTAAQERHRTALEGKLAHVIHSLALSREEIQNLPDTYSAAIQSGAFPDVLATNRYDFLPHDLFAANSGWHEILPGGLREPPILQHTLIAGGRCIFRTFLKLPTGANETTILDDVAVSMRRNPDKPYFGLPLGTRFLLLREMISLDENGQMVATHIVESVQFLSIDTLGHGFAREAELSRVLLFQGRQGGLRPIPKGELRTQGYGDLGHLHDDQNGNCPPRRKFPGNCSDCHLFVSIDNVLLSNAAAFLTPARSVSIEPIVRWKQESGKLDRLRKLIASPAADAN